MSFSVIEFESTNTDGRVGCCLLEILETYLDNKEKVDELVCTIFIYVLMCRTYVSTIRNRLLH